MADHTPTAWDLDVRSFMSDLLRTPFAADRPGEYVVTLAVTMANEVQKTREMRVRKVLDAELDGQLAVFAEQQKMAPNPLPSHLPKGTRISMEDDEALSELSLRVLEDGRIVYYGTWARSNADGYWSADEINWEHWRRAGGKS